MRILQYLIFVDFNKEVGDTMKHEFDLLGTSPQLHFRN